MHRINLSVDLDGNSILPEEIEKVIEGAVKAKTREYFQFTLEGELTRIAEAATEAWTHRTSWSTSPATSKLDKVLKAQIDARITEEIGKIEVSRYDIQQIIDDKLGEIDKLIAQTVADQLGKLSFEDFIIELVGDAVEKAIPAKILDLIVRGATAQK